MLSAINNTNYHQYNRNLPKFQLSSIIVVSICLHIGNSYFDNNWFSSINYFGSHDRCIIIGKIFWTISILSSIFIVIGTLYFLGYFRFDTPASSDSPGNRLWLYECKHYQDSYLCFPPYCAPGGLRSRLFPSTDCNRTEIEISEVLQNISSPAEGSETENNNTLYQTTKSTNNPLDLILQYPSILLPYFVKQALEERQHNWDTLGGSKCSSERNLFAFAREKNSSSALSHNQEGGSATYPEDHLIEEQKSQGEEGIFSNNRFERFEIAANRVSSFDGQAVSSYYHSQLAGSYFPTTDPQYTVSTKNQDLQTQEQKIKPHSHHFQPNMTAQQQNDESASPATAKVQVVEENAAGKPIPQAVLVYHESAHSIVFRDHLRRQQGAIRRTSSIMETSTHGGTTSPADLLRKQYTQPVSDVTPAPSRATSTILEVTEESDLGYESGGSRGSVHSSRSGGDSSSITSGGSGSRGAYKRVKSGLKKPIQKKPPVTTTSPNLQPVVIANFQPVIEPLESLDLNSSNLFEPLLDADPLAGTLEMTDAEAEVVELLKNEQAAVKTIRNADWTSFLQKFKPSEEGGGGQREYHPAQIKQNNANAKASGVEYPFNSFVTSTSLLPSCAKKMRKFCLIWAYIYHIVNKLSPTFLNVVLKQVVLVLPMNMPSGSCLHCQ